MNQNGSRLNNDPGLQIHITYVEECSPSGSLQENVIGEPSVQMCLVIRNQSVYIRGADILFVQVEHGDIRIILEHHAGNNLVADLYRFSGAVLRNILS